MKNTRGSYHVCTATAVMAVAAIACTNARAQTVQFFAEARLVEVYATIFDHKGRYVDDLPRERFRVAEDGMPQSILAFESDATGLSCAILLDTTGSMERALPVVKNAVLKLLDEMRDGDSVAIYSFNNTLTLLQPFTTDKQAAKRAVVRTRPQGCTALFDAIAGVAKDLRERSGKKAIVVFTDGRDNSSALSLEASIGPAMKVGAPVYAIGEGEALERDALMAQLTKLANLSGGGSFEARKSNDIEKIFTQISADLRHTYMLAYKPPASPESGRWRRIQVSVDGLRKYRVRAKGGYLAE